MEEHDERESAAAGGGRGGDEEAEPQVAAGVDGEVGGADAIDGLPRGGRFPVDEVEEPAFNSAIRPKCRAPNLKEDEHHGTCRPW